MTDKNRANSIECDTMVDDLPQIDNVAEDKITEDGEIQLSAENFSQLKPTGQIQNQGNQQNCEQLIKKCSNDRYRYNGFALLVTWGFVSSFFLVFASHRPRLVRVALYSLHQKARFLGCSAKAVLL